MSYVALWSRAFVLTLLIEVPTVVAMTRGSDRSWRARAAIACVAQLLTHPVVWCVFPRIPGLSRYTSLASAELFAWLAEGTVYALTAMAPRKLRAFGISGVANALSLALGFIVL